MDWSDVDAAEDFVQLAPDDSAYVDIDPFEVNEYEPAF